MNVSKRDCLKTLGATTALAVAPALIAKQAHRIVNVGLQLYTVRDAMAKDVSGTLASVAEAGYTEVETAGTGNLDSVQFARALRNIGLTAPSAHVSLDLLVAQPDDVLASAATIGYRYLVLPWLPSEMRSSSGYSQVIDVLNGFGAQCAQAGLQLCYHNHDFEFQAQQGERAFDRLLRECDRRYVKFELDLFWAAHAGADAAAYLRSDPERFPLCHVKDRSSAGKMVDVGQGTIDFPALFAAGTGLKHYFVEHDRPADPLSSIRNSIRGVQAMRF